MGAIPFETLKLARALREKAFQDEVATKTELGEQELSIKIGGMLVVAVRVVTALLKLSGIPGYSAATPVGSLEALESPSTLPARSVRSVMRADLPRRPRR